MDTFGINVKRLMLTLFVVFPLVGCLIVPTSARTYHTVFEPQCCPNQGSARLISTKESWQITGKRGIDVVELTNSQFKIQVYYVDPFPALEMRLIVPAGEELIIEEESIAIIFDTVTQQEIITVDIDWQITSEVNTKSEDNTEIENNTEKIDISGTYVSDITSNKNYFFGNTDGKLVFTLEQNGDRITAVNSAHNLKIGGTRKGNIIKFFVEPHRMNYFRNQNGVWEINPDGLNITGSWKVINWGVAGQWDLKRSVAKFYTENPVKQIAPIEYALTGTYMSKYTGKKLNHIPDFRKVNFEVELVQDGKKITGAFGESGKIWGDVVGETIKFDFFATGGWTRKGTWVVDPANNNLEGTVGSDAAEGWNLTKTSVSGLDNRPVSTEVKSQTTDSAEPGSSQSSSELSQSGVGKNSQPAINFIGPAPSPPATIYVTRSSVREYAGVEGKPHYIGLRLPVFRTKGNETIKFDDVTFRISIAPDEYNGEYLFIPLCC